MDSTSFEWWQRAVFYQIYPRSFMDSNGDGVGDLPGITSRLDYVSETLGVDAIWISPFFTSPMADFGYDVADYVDVDPIFGRLEDWDVLIAKAHEQGLKVIVDWVPNHSSSEHPWFIESRSSRDNPKRDWYVWRDPAPRGGPPNNWISVFTGPAWTFDDTTGQYYLHSFLAEQPDINWRNPEAKEAMLDTLRFWLDRGADGFRMDVTHFIMKDPEYRSNPVLDEPASGYKDLGEYDRLVHIHDRGHPDIHPLFREMRQIFDSYEPARFSIGEIHLTDWKEWAQYYGDNDELHMPYNFAMVSGPWTAEWARDIVESQEAVLPPGAWPNYVVGNHDEPRIATRLGERRARLATMLLLTLRGTPTLYYGDELGMLQADIPAEDQQDPWGRRRPGAGRDGCRTPMQWTADRFAGCGSENPWLLPVDPDGTRNVEAQLHDERSMLSFTRSLISFRRESEALMVGDYRGIDDLPDDVFGYRRTAGEDTYAIYLNFADQPTTIETEGPLLFASDPDQSDPLGGQLVLQPLSGVIVRP